MVNTLGTITKSIKPTMQWCIMADTYKYIDWIMNYICQKYKSETLKVFVMSRRIFLDDGIDINEFWFMTNESKIKSIHPDIYIDIEDFRRMWLLQ